MESTAARLDNRRRIDQINDMWSEDCKFDITKLAEEASNHYSLHAKYSDLLTVEKRQLRKMQAETEKFRFRLMRFYRDGPTIKEDLEEAINRGWTIPPGGKAHVKTDLKYWVDTNNEMIDMMLTLSDQNDIVEAIDNILKAINSRSYSINSAIDMVIHNNGG